MTPPSLYAPWKPLNPLVVIGKFVLGLTQRASGIATLITPAQAVLPLRMLGAVNMLFAHHRMIARPAIRTWLRGTAAETASDPLCYFLNYLVPAVQRHDWSADRTGVIVEQQQVDPAAWCEETLKTAPAPYVPSPSILGSDGIYPLEATEELRSGTRVIVGDRVLAPTGCRLRSDDLHGEWLTRLKRHALDRSNRRAGGDDSWRQPALRTLEQRGYLQAGDLLYLQGTTPRLGHVIPAHFNRTFSVQVEGDMAMTMPLTLPPVIAAPSLFRRDAAGRWRPASLPNGLCLGPQPSRAVMSSPGVAAVAHLRWAAVRVAENGRFHERDP